MHCIFSIDLVFFPYIGSSVSDVQFVCNERKSKTYLRVFGDFLCGEVSEQTIYLKFYVKNEIECSEAFKMLEKSENNAKPGHPSTCITDENVKKINAIVLANSRITIREVAEEIGISYGSCESIFISVLNMKRV